MNRAVRPNNLIEKKDCNPCLPAWLIFEQPLGAHFAQLCSFENTILVCFQCIIDFVEPVSLPGINPDSSVAKFLYVLHREIP